MLELPLEHLAQPFGAVGPLAGDMQGMDRRPDRCEWIAQLVRKGGEEFVLPRVDFLNFLEEQAVVDSGCRAGSDVGGKRQPGIVELSRWRARHQAEHAMRLATR